MLKRYDNLLNLNATMSRELFEKCNHPWEVLSLLNEYILSLFSKLDNDYIKINSNVYVHKDAVISEGATILGPTIIGANSEVRPGAYIRGNVIVGENVVIGNSTEVKNAVLFNNVRCPHYNYVGDSVLGEYAHIGAGVVLSNIKSDKKNILIKLDDKLIDTGLRKFGSILGDNVEIGCNSVLCPGTLIFPNTSVYPLTMVRGVIEPDKIVKKMDDIVSKIER